MYQANARSLRNKFLELVSLVNSQDFDIVCITESWVSEKFNNDLLIEYDIEGYKKFLYQRDTRQGGGVILYVREDLTIRNVHNIKEDRNVESVWLDLKTERNIWVRLGLFYRSPCCPNGNDINYLKALNKKYVEEIYRGFNSIDSKIVLLLGDFNYPDIDWDLYHANDDLSLEFLDCVQENFLEQVVNVQTRGKNCLDLVLTNCSTIVSNMEVLAPLGNSDHNSLAFSLDIKTQSSTNNKEIYNYKNGDYDKVRRMLRYIDWDDKFKNKSCHEMWQLFKEVLEEIQVECITKVTFRSGNFKRKPEWFDNEIHSLIKRKHNANDKLIKNGYQENDLLYYREIRDKVKAVIRKKNIQEDITLGNDKNPKHLFRKYKSKARVKEQISFIKKGDQIFSGDKNIADGFNSFFSSVFSNSDNNMFQYKNQYDDVRGNSNSIKSFEISVESVSKIIKSLNINKSMGPDNINSQILKEGEVSISYALTKIFNKSLANSEVPMDWKLANVVPIFKKGDKEMLENYRPISLTSVVCRIMEKVIKYELVEFLNKHDIIVNSQHGFRNNRSCLTNLIEYTEYVTKIMDSGNSADVVYLDFSKAFDKVCHIKLLNKLWRYGIQGNIYNWLGNWLLGRKQRVVLNGEASNWVDVTSGVPQGSVLGPLLFILYANDLDFGISCKLFKFADDTKMVIPIKGLDDNINGQKNVDKLVGWADRWDMKYNESKCKVLHIGSNNPKFNYSMNGVWLGDSKVEKDLGVYVDDKLKFSKQCLEARNRANKMLGFISRNVGHRSKEVIKTLYNAYVRPHLEYCVQVWSPHYQKDLVMLEKVQRRATRLISGFKRLDYETRLRELNMFSLQRRYKRGDMIEVFKILTGLDNLKFDDLFELDVDGRRGHSKKLKVKSARLDVRKYSFSVRVVSLWNKLSEETVTSTSLATFKRLLDRDMSRLGIS